MVNFLTHRAQKQQQRPARLGQDDFTWQSPSKRHGGPATLELDSPPLSKEREKSGRRRGAPDQGAVDEQRGVEQQDMQVSEDALRRGGKDSNNRSGNGWIGG